MSLTEMAIGWLAPPLCVGCGLEGSALCKTCATSGITAFGERCWRCNTLSPGCRTCDGCRHAGSPRYVWITASYDDLAQKLVQKYKFGHLRAVAQPLARLMTETFLSFNEKIRPHSYLIVPIPTATSRIRERGFGHSELLAKTVAQNLKMEYFIALRRLGQTRQLGSHRQDRLTQQTNNYAVKNPRKIAGRHILLIDDVVTTGGTITAATAILRASGAKQVDALLFAKRL